MGGSWKNLSGKKLSKNATIKSNAAFNHRTIDRKLKHSRTIIDRYLVFYKTVIAIIKKNQNFHISFNKFCI